MYFIKLNRGILLLNISNNKMEKKLNLKSEQFLTKFKDDIREMLIKLKFSENDKANDLLEYVYEYERLMFNKDDLSKRKRVKNSIPTQNRCNAKRANGEQCTRKRKDGCEFCGTHAKGVPYGLSAEECVVCTKQIDVFVTDIMGIVYYVDKFNNVYKTEDILEKKTDPAIIAKCKKINGVMCIPEFGLC
jgi:hypothetical protein